MIKVSKDTVADEQTIRLLEDSVHEFEICCRLAIESVLAAPTMNVRRFGTSEILVNPGSASCNIRSGNGEYSVTITLGFDPADLTTLVPGDSSQEMQLDAIGEITNVIAGSFLSPHRFIDRFGAILPSLPFFVNGVSDACRNPTDRNLEEKSPAQGSWCIQGQLRVNSVKVFLAVTIGKTAREGGFPCKNPL